MAEKTELDEGACCNNCNLAPRCVWRYALAATLLAVKDDRTVLLAATKVCPFWTPWRETR